MFTGLVEKIGVVKRVSRGRGLVIEFAFDPWPEPLEPGESVAVNGACLTVVRCDASRFTADVLRETEERTGLAELKPGDRVNLERAVKAGDRLGGHIVQGHVDARGELVERKVKGRDVSMKFRCGRVVAAASVYKGSITINGVSLTVSGLGEDWISVDLIPTTLNGTNLGRLSVGDKVNLESDVLGRYAMKNQESETNKEDGGLTFETLAENGFC